MKVTFKKSTLEVGFEAEKVYPALEKLSVKPTGEKQIFKPETYGFEEVEVEGVESEELAIAPNVEDQIHEGLYNKVTVKGESNFKKENIKKGTSMWGLEGTMEAAWDTSQIRQCYNMFRDNTEIVEAPNIDLSNVTTMVYMFYGCSNLLKVPNYNTPKNTSIQSTFYRCASLIKAPDMDTSNVTSVNQTFNGCINLIYVPDYNFTDKLITGGNTFYGCTSLVEAPNWNMSSTTGVSYMYSGCTKLIKIPAINLEKANNISNIVQSCTNLETLGGFINLGKGYTQKSNNYSNYALDLSKSTKLTRESLMNIINNLYDLNLSYDVANGGTLYSQQLKLGNTNIAKLTAEEIAIATSKRLVS